MVSDTKQHHTTLFSFEGGSCKTVEKIDEDNDLTAVAMAWHQQARLSLKHPIWLDKPSRDMTATSAWKDEWVAVNLTNQSPIAERLSVLVASTCPDDSLSDFGCAVVTVPTTSLLTGTSH